MTSFSYMAAHTNYFRRQTGGNTTEGSPEIPSVCLEGFSPRICMSSLWPSGGPKIVHKGVETGGCSSPPSRNTFDNLSGRSFIYESVQRRSRSGHGHSTVSARKSRFRDQSRKVLLRSNTEYGVSRFRCEHSGYDSAPSQLQSGINKIPLQLPASAPRSLGKGSLPVDWEVDCVYTSNLSRSSTLPSRP